MGERGFFTGFLMPMMAAVAVVALTEPRRGPAARQVSSGGEEKTPRGTEGQSIKGPVQGDGRGRAAEKPYQIPARGWRDIVLRLKNELAKDNISIVSAGIAFYAMLSMFPALGAAVSLYGLVADPVEVERQLAELAGILPEGARTLITDQLASIASQPRGKLSLGVLFGIVLALWSASAAIRTLMDGLNVVYDEKEKRGFVPYYATALALTFGGIVAGVLALSLVAALPAIIKWTGLPSIQTAIALLRWPLLAVATMFGLAVLYRYGPSRKAAQWQWVSWGAVVATLLWIVVSAGFSSYVSNFGNYNETYGALGAVIILLMWFYLSAYVILLGGELNAEMEHQTAHDTTKHRGAPLGQRGAYVADTVGAVP